jgi:hypothetical protein
VIIGTIIIWMANKTAIFWSNLWPKLQEMGGNQGCGLWQCPCICLAIVKILYLKREIKGEMGYKLSTVTILHLFGSALATLLLSCSVPRLFIWIYGKGIVIILRGNELTLTSGNQAIPLSTASSAFSEQELRPWLWKWDSGCGVGESEKIEWVRWLGSGE